MLAYINIIAQSCGENNVLHTFQYRPNEDLYDCLFSPFVLQIIRQKLKASSNE